MVAFFVVFVLGFFVDFVLDFLTIFEAVFFGTSGTLDFSTDFLDSLSKKAFLAKQR